MVVNVRSQQLKKVTIVNNCNKNAEKTCIPTEVCYTYYNGLRSNEEGDGLLCY